MGNLVHLKDFNDEYMYESWCEYNEFGREVYSKSKFDDSDTHIVEAWREWDTYGNMIYMKEVATEDNKVSTLERWQEFNEEGKLTCIKDSRGSFLTVRYDDDGKFVGVN